MHTYKMIIAFDGTNYSGWQMQKNGVSIQECLQSHIKILAKEDVAVNGSGRTDAGVHALGQIAHFKCQKNLDLHSFLKSLNALLPDDIRIVSIEEAPSNFHARYMAVSKTYHYHLQLRRVESPFTSLYSWHIREKIDLHLLKAAASLFVGKHDFTSFTNHADRGSAARNPIRTIYRLDVIHEGDSIRLEFQGDGFLYKMVRNITGTLIAVATGKRPCEDIPRLFAAKERRLASKAAPAHGLFLVSVEYPDISGYTGL